MELRRVPEPKFFPPSFIDYIVDDITSKNLKVVGISGPSGAGKTTLGRLVERKLAQLDIDTCRISVDDYFNMSRDRMRELGLTGYHWKTRNVSQLQKDIHTLLQGEQVIRKGWDPVKEVPHVLPQFYMPADVIILEGTLDFSTIAEFTAFIEIPDEKIIERRLARDTQKTSFASQQDLEAYLRGESIPAYQQLLRPAARKADIIFDSVSNLVILPDKKVT